MTSPDAGRAITATSVVVAGPDQVSSEMAGESILLSMRTAQYYGLGEVGARIWELVQQPARVSDVRDTIVREYDVEAERCERDLLELLRRLAAEGLIEVTE